MWSIRRPGGHDDRSQSVFKEFPALLPLVITETYRIAKGSLGRQRSTSIRRHADITHAPANYVHASTHARGIRESHKTGNGNDGTVIPNYYCL